MSASSNSFASTVDLRLRPSTAALRWIFVLHIAGIGMLPFAMPAGWPMVAVVAAFAASWLSLRRHKAFGFGARAIERIVWDANGEWRVFCGREVLHVELERGSLVHPRLMVLRFRGADGWRGSRIITGNEAAPVPLRQLRARLSLG